jgi:hypothetical protein
LLKALELKHSTATVREELGFDAVALPFVQHGAKSRWWRCVRHPAPRTIVLRSEWRLQSFGIVTAKNGE